MACKSYEEVRKALRICMTHVTPTICQGCPYGGDCVGDNVPLLEDVEAMLEDFAKSGMVAACKEAAVENMIAGAGMPAYILTQKGKRGKWIVKTSRFRATDMDKLGNTVFLRKADAFRELRRRQNGY